MKTTFRSRSNDRSSARHQRKILERELADYTSQTDRFDLEAMLDRYPDEQTLEIRQMLSRQAAHS